MSTRRENDFYPTRVHGVTRALLDRVVLPDVVGEPCAGDGDIAQVIRETGRTVVETDIVDGFDVFSPKTAEIYEGVPAIVTNPPYSVAPDLIRRLREWSPLVCAFLRLSFLEPCTNGRSARTDLLADLSSIVVCPRVSFTGDGKTDSVTGAWMIWDDSRAGRARTFSIVTPSDLERYSGQQTLGV